LKRNMKIVSPSKELIFEMTKKVSPREQAIFTIMRQTGLPPEIIKKLKYKDLEKTKQFPRKIEVRQFQTSREKPPVFIGEEASFYLDRYLASRNDLTPESPLFCTRSKKELNEKNLSRTFRQTLDNITKEKKHGKLDSTNNQPKTNRRKFSVYSLVRFYQKNAELYEKALKDNPNESDEFYKRLYKEKAMPYLEIDSLITINLTKKQRRTELANRDYTIKEMKQTIVRDNEYINSIMVLLYTNMGDYETGENIKLGDTLIDLWKETSKLQFRNMGDAWVGKKKLIEPDKDIVQELITTLKAIKKPYDELYNA
jgi:hypothetical protein